jgi:outer membrane immunogenic protein
MKTFSLIGTIFAALSASSAMAADVAPRLPMKAPVASSNVNWTGFYLGANVGAGWGSRSVDYTANDPATVLMFGTGFGGAPPSTSFKSSGAIGGLQLGYNWQLNRNWLVGVETDFDWSAIKGSGSNTGIIPAAIPFTASADEQIKWLGTVRARLGFLPTHTLLTYVTGGFAYGRIQQSASYANNSATTGFGSTSGTLGFQCDAATTCFAGSSSRTATGWTVGGGFEYALGANVSFKAEYLYVNLSGAAVTETASTFATGLFPAAAPATFNANSSRTVVNVARVGLNYRF